MTDAPEKIYAWADCEYEVGVWNGHGDKRYTPDQAKEYTRTDIAQAKIAELENALAAASGTIAAMREPVDVSP